MDLDSGFKINSRSDLADYNLIKLSLISNLTKEITNKVLSNIRSESLPSELNNDFDIFIVESIKNKINKVVKKGV